MNQLRKFAGNALLLGLGLLAIPLVLEIVLRFFPVFSGMPVNRTSAVYSFIPNVTIQRSSHWDMRNARKRQVNNAGFISDQSYDREAQTPLIAMVGDSYIEAMQVDYVDTAEAQLSANCSQHARVYSFGAQFAPLSQYLSWAQYISQTYRPKIMVVNIVGNDFDESLLSHQIAFNQGGVPGMQFYDFSNDVPRLVTVPFKPESWITQALRHSVLAQYLVRNLGIVNLANDYRNYLHSLVMSHQQSQSPSPSHSEKQKNTAVNSHEWFVAEPATQSPSKSLAGADPVIKKPTSEYVGNAKRAYSIEKLQLSKKAVDAFLNDLPKVTHLPVDSIILVVDAERPLIYTDEGQQDLNSFFSVMRSYLIERAKILGFTVVDLRPAMIEQFRRDGKHFEFVDDNHWNAIGHRLMAQSLLEVSGIQALCQKAAK